MPRLRAWNSNITMWRACFRPCRRLNSHIGAARADSGWCSAIVAPVLRADASRRSGYGRAACLRPVRCARRRSGAGPGWLWLALNAVALRPSAPDWAGWHLLRYGLRSGGGLWPSRLLAPSAVRAAAEQCLAGQADTCAGTRLPYGRARRTGMAGTRSGTDCAAAEGYGRAACLRPVRCERRPNSAWLGRPTPAPIRDCPTAERAGLGWLALAPVRTAQRDRKSTRLNSSHVSISY